MGGVVDVPGVKGVELSNVFLTPINAAEIADRITDALALPRYCVVDVRGLAGMLTVVTHDNTLTDPILVEEYNHNRAFHIPGLDGSIYTSVANDAPGKTGWLIEFARGHISLKHMYRHQVDRVVVLIPS